MTTIRVDGSEIRYSDWSVTAGTSDTALAPVATIETAARAATVSAGDRLVIERDDSTTIFEGDIIDAPTRRDGSQKLDCEHDYHRVFAESVTLDLTSPTAEDVLRQALSESDGGASADLTYGASAVSLDGDYQVENRSVKRVFRDMADRVGAVWWVDTGDSVTFDDPGGRGTWAALDATTDRFVVTKYDAADLETVVNDQTVTGTGGERVSASAEDATSISEYGRREGDPVNVSYITSATEAQSYADQLLTPDPESGAEVVVPDGVGGDTSQFLANYDLAVSDPNGTGIDDTLVIEEQVIEQGRMTVQLGAASARGKIQVNRSAKSKDDVTEPGSVFGNDRIADNAVDTPQLVDTAVIEQKLADLSVSLEKIQDLAVDTSKIQDLSIDETKVQDDSISTPKIQAQAVTANEIFTQTITSNELASEAVITQVLDARAVTAAKVDTDTLTANEIASRTITALEIATDTLTANEVDTLDLDTQEISIGSGLDGVIEFSDTTAGTDTVAVMLPSQDNDCFIGLPGTRFAEGHFRELNASNYVTQTPEAMARPDLSQLTGYSWRNPPEAVVQRETGDGAYRRENPSKEGVELGHMTNYLLETCKAQQEKIDELEERIAALEGKV